MKLEESHLDQKDLLFLKNYKSPDQTSNEGNKTACYPDLGCFTKNHFGKLPSSLESIGTTMWLFTRNNRKKGQKLKYNKKKTITNSNFDPSKDTKFIIHGFGGSCKLKILKKLRPALLKAENVNVICVDWAPGAAKPDYFTAAANCDLVGKQISTMIGTINEVFGQDINNKTHLIGWSLGGQVAGMTGYYLGGNLGRISALDPAGPLFEDYEIDVRLDATDANYVDVIHTDGDNFGMEKAAGHVDYYPNGGEDQPGCGLEFGSCSHGRAPEMYLKSIALPPNSSDCYFRSNPCKSYAKFQKGKCNSCFDTDLDECGIMGYHSEKSKGVGNQYLLTKSKKPFCTKNQP